MSDTKNSGDKTLSAPKTLSLKRPVEQGVVRQSFSHGRTKAVVVEKVKRRVVGAEAPAVKAEAPAPAPIVKPQPAQTPSGRAAPARANAPQQSQRSGAPGVVLRTLTEEERDARTRALLGALLVTILDRITAISAIQLNMLGLQWEFNYVRYILFGLILLAMLRYRPQGLLPEPRRTTRAHGVFAGE